MIRKIIHIDEEKMQRCGACVTACHEVPSPCKRQGQADAGRLLRRLWRLPAGCPTGAITFTEREAAAYDEQAVLENKQKKAAAAQQPGTARRTGVPWLPGSHDETVPP